MSNFEVTELTWENGQLAMHELGGIFPPTSTSSGPPKPTWAGGGFRTGDTLESIVHQATYYNKPSPSPIPSPNLIQNNMETVGSVVASSGGKWAVSSGPLQNPGPPPCLGVVKKRTRLEFDNCGNNNFATSLANNDHESACASQNAAFSRENNDTTMMTWASLESPRSCTRTKTTIDEDSSCQGGSENQEQERGSKGETGRSSYTTRKGRAATVHNQSERRRRDRINQKMKALQKLVPNASKTDKASMLDEVIEYLKQLQAQVQMMSNARFMPQLMMPLGIQQHHLHQLSLLARMGMGMGMGMLDTANLISPSPPPQPPLNHPLVHPTQVGTATSAFVPPGFNPDPGTSISAPLQDPYSTLLAQSMNIELYNRMAALQRQQQTPSQLTSNQLLSNHHVQGS